MTKRSDIAAWRRLIPVVVAAVWLHQGLWCKVLGRDPSHRAVLGTVPGLRGPNTETGLRGLNAETGLRGPNAETGLRGPNAETRLTGRRADVATTLLGLTETALAVGVATGGRRRWVAGLQTALVAAFNAGGLLLGRQHIEHPGRLLIRNGVFLALVWSPVDGRHHR
jgi:hypothetical protein